MSVPLHDSDFYAWTQQQAALLKQGRLDQIDLEHLIEEVESMGASERNQLQSRLKILLGHLLKWQFQPRFRSRSWNATIEEQRLSVIGLLEDNPSLKNMLEERLLKAYPQGVLLAVKETNMDKRSFPSVCPYSLEQILDTAFYPDAS
jgi:hypothetical protein